MSRAPPQIRRIGLRYRSIDVPRLEKDIYGELSSLALERWGQRMTQNSPNNRRSERAEVAIGAKCRTGVSPPIFVAIIDLTTAGCRIFGRDAQFTVGQRIILSSECLAPLSGTIQWSNGWLAGVKFESGLYLAVFEHLVRNQSSILSQSAKSALNEHADLPVAVEREMAQILDHLENKFRKRREERDPVTKPLTVDGSRPGLAFNKADPNQVKNFLR